MSQTLSDTIPVQASAPAATQPDALERSGEGRSVVNQTPIPEADLDAVSAVVQTLSYMSPDGSTDLR